jgi:DNA phosphorothioation-dependent restriction protein DptF
MNTVEPQHFINILNKCKQSSKEAVENLESFNEFKQYMHIQRPVEIELERHILDAHTSTCARLILVCGGVGDGKSHILSYLKDKHPFLNDETIFYLHNDATESFSPTKTSIETLAKVLKPFSDIGLEVGGIKSIILAINLGALNNFIDSEEGKAFSRLKAYVYQKKILESVISDEVSSDDHIFKYVNFSDYHMYELTENGPRSVYIKGIFQKVTQKMNDNPFYQTYLRDYESDPEIAAKNPIIQNYELLQHEDVQDKVISLIIEVMIKEKLIISMRALLDFIYNLLVPSVMENRDHKRICEYVRDQKFMDYVMCLLPFQIFGRVDATVIHQALDRLSPTRTRTEQLDQFLIEFKSLKEGADLFADNIDLSRLPYFSKFLFTNSPWRIQDDKDQGYKQRLIKLFVYLYYLIPKEEHDCFVDKTYEQFMKYLYHWNKDDISKLAKLYKDDVRDAIYKWNGEANGDLLYVQVGQPQTQYYALQKLEIEPYVHRVSPLNETNLFKFLTMMTIQFKTKNATYSSDSEIPTIDIDYSLYALLIRIKNGYRPNKKDKFQYIKFVEFIDKLNNSGSPKNELVFESKNFGKSNRYRLQYDTTFDQYTFMEM